MNDKPTQLKAQLKELVILLNRIRRTYAFERSETIGLVQDHVWNEPELQGEGLYFLQELAGDLNFYEPIAEDRDATLGYYGDDRLAELTTTALRRLESILAAPRLAQD